MNHYNAYLYRKIIANNLWTHIRALFCKHEFEIVWGYMGHLHCKHCGFKKEK